MPHAVVISGDREWTNLFIIREKIRELVQLHGSNLKVISGGARGADKLAKTACGNLGIEKQFHEEMADWIGRGRHIAGRERNERMLSMGISQIFAFKDKFDFTLCKGGTEHMCKIGVVAGVEVNLFSKNEWLILTGRYIANQLYADVKRVLM